eukprot:evm.model.scf_123.4 EVM.evm.TU.scf_123.4   scf_123:101975-105383(-)
MVNDIQRESQEVREARRAARTPRKRPCLDSSENSKQTQRRSARVAGQAPVCYNDQVLVIGEALASRANGKRRKREYVAGGEEKYETRHLKALRAHKKEWKLFVDGYSADGKRLYDPVKGKTCHQCRQKTLGKHTKCTKCERLQGVFCGDCLFMRYGENVDEANKSKDWTCPVCRDICNCSFCRQRKGWAPTGLAFRKALALGYKSVAHYLVLTHLDSTGNAQAETQASVENRRQP